MRSARRGEREKSVRRRRERKRSARGRGKSERSTRCLQERDAEKGNKRGRRREDDVPSRHMAWLRRSQGIRVDDGVHHEKRQGEDVRCGGRPRERLKSSERRTGDGKRETKREEKGRRPENRNRDRTDRAVETLCSSCRTCLKDGVPKQPRQPRTASLDVGASDSTDVVKAPTTLQHHDGYDSVYVRMRWAGLEVQAQNSRGIRGAERFVARLRRVEANLESGAVPLD